MQRGWKYYQVVRQNTYHGGHIETDHQVTCSIPEYFSKHGVFPKFTASGTEMLRGVIDNYITTRDKMYLNGLEVTKV